MTLFFAIENKDFSLLKSIEVKFEVIFWNQMKSLQSFSCAIYGECLSSNKKKTTILSRTTITE